MHKTRSVLYLFIAISNIFVSIPCIKIWGTKGAAMGTAISLLVGNGLFMNIYYHKKIGLNILYFWHETLKMLPSMLVAASIGLLLKFFVPAGNLLLLAIKIVIYCLVYTIAMWLMGMNDYEKSLLRKPMQRMGARICKK